MSRAIFVKTGSAGQRYELNVEPTNTIAQVKSMLVAQVRASPFKEISLPTGSPRGLARPGLASLIDSHTRRMSFSRATQSRCWPALREPRVTHCNPVMR